MVPSFGEPNQAKEFSKKEADLLFSSHCKETQWAKGNGLD